MSDYTPITGELRDAGWRIGDGATDVQKFDGGTFDNLCDAIDAIHAELERENERLHRELDERPIAVGADAAKTIARLERENAKLKAENLRLRELISDVHEALCSDKADMFRKPIIKSLERDMRELGMEVD